MLLIHFSKTSIKQLLTEQFILIIQYIQKKKNYQHKTIVSNFLINSRNFYLIKSVSQ